MWHSLFNQSTVDGHLVCSHALSSSLLLKRYCHKHSLDYQFLIDVEAALAAAVLCIFHNQGIIQVQILMTIFDT